MSSARTGAAEGADILVSLAEGVATVVFNRPHVRNALTLAMWGRLRPLMHELGADPAVRAVVLRGAGTEAFASGADISEFRQVLKDAATGRRYSEETEAAYVAVRDCPTPTVAMIHGPCIGGAMGLAAACDFRFAAEGARFAIPASRLGIVYGLEGTRQLITLLGPTRAKDLLFTGRAVEGPEAVEVGFVDRLLPAAELEPGTYGFLRTIVGNARLSVEGAKAAIHAIVEDGAVRRAAEIQRRVLEAFDSADYREGTRAFLEKRQPHFGVG